MFNPKPEKDLLHFKFPLQCVWLKLNGSWPLNPILLSPVEYGFAIFYKMWSLYVILSVGITIYFQIAFLFNTFGDIMVTTENCCTTFMGVLNFVRILHLRQNQSQFRSVITQFVEHIWIRKNTYPTIEAWCSRNMRTFRIISLLLTCLITMYCLLPLIEIYTRSTTDADNTDKLFPYKMLFPYDANHGWRYIITYIFTSYAGVCVVTTLFAEDSLFGFFITYTCGQFRILHSHINNIVSESITSVQHYSTDPISDFQRECTKCLTRVAIKHNKLLNFAQCLENFFSPILLVNFVISSILICMVGFQLVTGKNMFIGDYIKFLVYISSSLSQLFILCWNGDILIQHSFDTVNHLYSCNWERGNIIETRSQENKLIVQTSRSLSYSTGKVFGENLQIMIMRSQRYTHITAMKFSILSLQSFSRIISTSMSYFALLQSFYEDKGNK